MPILSIIILNYNSGNYLIKCLESINSNTLAKKDYEIIIVDNASTEQLPKINKTKYKNLKIFYRDKNDGFAKGNNFGIQKISKTSKYVFFLNPDTILEKNTLQKIISTFKQNHAVDAISPNIILAKTGQLQPECHRGFPYPLRSLAHFLSLSNRGYFLTNLDLTKPHVIEAGVGAALILKRIVGEKIHWWDEDYFMYGEDIQMGWDIKKNNYSLWFMPDIKLTHFQGISSGVKKHTNSKASTQTIKRSLLAGTQAMRLFHNKNLSSSYPGLVNKLIILAIDILEKIRLSKLTT